MYVLIYGHSKQLSLNVLDQKKSAKSNIFELGGFFLFDVWKYFGKVVLLRFKEFHGLHDDLKSI